ncbi:MAG: hypothetical protein GX620_11640 [Chloroflexi bacterium]|nr:hypothetical protein [Chloroflexota bacterium]
MTEKSAKTNAMRVLDAHGVRYELITFSSEIHSAVGVSQELGYPIEQVVKTLVALRESGQPLLVMVAGDRELSLKLVARAVGDKKVRMASMREAESLTGLEVGGISALPLLNKPFDILVDRRVMEQSHVLISAGRRGANLRLATADLVRVTGARAIEATRS